MSKNIKDTLKLALEALETSMYPQQKQLQAITAIKEALSSPNGEAQPEQRSVSEHLEPVATLDDLEQEIYENTRQFVSSDVMEWMLKRYYTTPPQRDSSATPLTWVGLTDEEMWQLVNDCIIGGDLHADKFVKAIETKLKGKNTDA